MKIIDTFRYAGDAATGAPLRTGLLILAMSIGVAAVVILTALGDGARRYVVGEFSAIGSNLIIVLPGRSETRGFNPANLITSTPRDLTLEDANALLRLPQVQRISPILIATTEINAAGKLRETMLLGTNDEYIRVRQLKMGLGRFLTKDEVGHGSAEVVLGALIRREIFGTENPLGKTVRVGDRRLRVVGVLSEGGRGMGMTTDELVIVPVATAQAMLNTNTLFRIMVEARSREQLGEVKARVLKLITQRHEGEEDVTVITQDAVLQTFDKILNVLTLGVAGIAAISLAVAGILVMNVMLVSVTQRTGEIGLLKALGATSGAVRQLFMVEAVLLSLSGAIVGVGLGYLGAAFLRYLYPTFPAYPPLWAVLAGLGTALVSGLVFGVMPARRAAQLDPIQALSKR
ncbi:MAG: ABC transporter permease [Methylotenera sp.]|nr:ABC transporter permease [Methylotenera sp.]MDP1597075.1 ABC transporter permease [Methylotenera sp.]MDP1754630.1 ABC transporter permease [Methylotenera sp.]MDP1959886.1 ABC transporter permease [Methylotenera sp.]MDP3942031.1 ABC transporter permease [Methylotenera sp.]